MLGLAKSERPTSW